MKSAEIAPRSLHGVLLTLVAGVLAALALSGCPKSYPDCDDDKGCKSHGEVCIDGKCRQCRDDSQCTKLDACMTCVANECVKRAGCCKSDLDCPNSRASASALRRIREWEAPGVTFNMRFYLNPIRVQRASRRYCGAS